jgi:hypothetical protein
MGGGWMSFNEWGGNADTIETSVAIKYTLSE